MRALIMAALCCLIVTAAEARVAPEQQIIIPDAAAVAPYPMEHSVKAVRHYQRRVVANPRKVVKPGKASPVKTASPAPTKAQAVAASPVDVIKTGADLAAAALGKLLGLPEGFAEGISTPHPVWNGKRPQVLSGTLAIGSNRFRFGSGGYGWSIPYGDWAVTPEAIGPWGSRHGAIGLAGGSIWDPKLHRYREGIELHGGGLSTQGCVAIDGWAQAKKLILSMVSQFGHAFLHMRPDGATISPTRWTAPTLIAEAGKSSPEAEHHRRYATRRSHYHHYVHRGRYHYAGV